MVVVKALQSKSPAVCIAKYKHGRLIYTVGLLASSGQKAHWLEYLLDFAFSIESTVLITIILTRHGDACTRYPVKVTSERALSASILPGRNSRGIGFDCRLTVSPWARLIRIWFVPTRKAPGAPEPRSVLTISVLLWTRANGTAMLPLAMEVIKKA